MDVDERVALVRKIVALQTRNQNDDDGDRYLSDANLAMEAIDEVLEVEDPTASPSGALRMYLEA